MNILITAPGLNPSQNVNGISTVVITIIQHNRQHHYHHYLLGSPDKPLPKIKWLIMSIRQLGLFPLALRKNKIELVHQNLPFDLKGILREYIINFWCRLFRVRVVLHVHGGLFLMNGVSNKFCKFLSQRLLEHSRTVIVLSEIEQEALKKNYQYSSALVLHNSIDVNQYLHFRERKTNEKPVLLFLGRIHESKGVSDIIDAFKLLKKEFDFRFILCGVGPLKDKFISECSQLLREDFEYLGIVSGNEKLNVIRNSDYFLLPSRYGEGLPMALLETMAGGLVPIVTDDASMKYVVQHLKNGIRVEKENPVDLYIKLKQIFLNPASYKSLSENATRTIVERYDISNYVTQLNKIYNISSN